MERLVRHITKKLAVQIPLHPSLPLYPWARRLTQIALYECEQTLSWWSEGPLGADNYYYYSFVYYGNNVIFGVKLKILCGYN